MPPRAGQHTLLGLESALASLRYPESRFAFEIYGQDGQIFYLVRSENYPPLPYVLASCYPQAQFSGLGDYAGRDHEMARDWLSLRHDERQHVLLGHLAAEPYLPLKSCDDQGLRQGEVDPLASILGYLAAVSRGGRRVGVRLLFRPAPSDWGAAWQRNLQRRLDRQDLSTAPTAPAAGRAADAGFLESVPIWAWLALAGAGGLGYLNWLLIQQQNYLAAAGADAAALTLSAGSVFLYRRLFGKPATRQYFDEQMVADKLASLGFITELQLTAFLPAQEGDAIAQDLLNGLAAAYVQFDHSAGNRWRWSRRRTLKTPTQQLLTSEPAPPLLGFQPLDKRRAHRSILSPRELATLWHLPLGESEVAAMPRAAARQLRPYLLGVDDGPLVGHVVGSDAPVRVSDAALRRHMLLLGKSGMGKSTFLKHILQGKFQAKARGEDSDAIVVVDPHADLIADLMPLVPPEIAHLTRLIDIGREDRAPAINLIDPDRFADRDRCIASIVDTLRFLSGVAWGPRMQAIFDHGLKGLYEYNAHPDTPYQQRLTLLDLLPLLAGAEPAPAAAAASSGGRGRRPPPAAPSAFQQQVLARVSDPEVLAWFRRFQGWSDQLRSEALAPVETRISAFASDVRARGVLGQWETTVSFSDALREGQIILVNPASGVVGPWVSALLGSTVVGLLDSALREQEKLPPDQRKRCLLVADEFHTIVGANWEELLAGIRKYGCAVLLATQSMARLDTPERNLKDGVLANVGGIVCYQMSGGDARIIADQVGRESGITETDLVSLDPYYAYVKLTTGESSLPPFAIRTREPDAGDPAAAQLIIDGLPNYTRDRRESLAAIARRMAEHEGFPLPAEAGATGAAAAGSDRAGGGAGAAPEGTRLRGVAEDAVAASQLDETTLAMIQRHLHDPGVQAVFDAGLKGRVNSLVAQGRREDRERIRQEERERAQRERPAAGTPSAAPEPAAPEPPAPERAAPPSEPTAEPADIFPPLPPEPPAPPVEPEPESAPALPFNRGRSRMGKRG